jgi:hypothetical protein
VDYIHALCGCLYVLSLLAGHPPISDSHYRKIVTLGATGIEKLIIMTAANVEAMAGLSEYVQTLCFTPDGSHEPIYHCSASSFTNPRNKGASVVDLVVNSEVYQRYLPNPAPPLHQRPHGLVIGLSVYNMLMCLVDGVRRLSLTR